MINLIGCSSSFIVHIVVCVSVLLCVYVSYLLYGGYGLLHISIRPQGVVIYGITGLYKFILEYFKVLIPDDPRNLFKTQPHCRYPRFH
jgi:hypothetical protein